MVEKPKTTIADMTDMRIAPFNFKLLDLIKSENSTKLISAKREVKMNISTRNLFSQ